jgi:hypothetical protein
MSVNKNDVQLEPPGEQIVNPVNIDWIKVSDQFPDYRKHRYVIVYIPTEPYKKIDVECVYNNGRGGSCFSTGWNKGETWEVTHWMPIPDKPTD